MTKQSFLLSAVIAFSAIFYLSSCCEHDPIDPIDPCETPELATVKDLTGLDGCGLVLEMVGDNKIVEPVGADLAGKGFKDGDLVTVGLHPVKVVSICMVGETAEVLCIEKLEVTPQKK
jgi:hypothetical protein